MGSVEDVARGSGRISGALTGPDVPPPRRDPVRTVVRTIGEVLITLGVVVLLFVIYEVYVTDLISAGKQRDATAALDDRWKGEQDPQRVDHFEGLREGEGFAKMYIPAFGSDYQFTIIEGTTEKSLEIGPGHYIDTAYPGDPGNFAVAGHRVGKGAPFNDIDLLASCDAIIVETQNKWYIYRVLPMADEVQDWAEIAKTKPRCNVTGSQGRKQEVNPLPGDYARTVGREIVAPSQGSVIAPIPHLPQSIGSAGDLEPLMTLTTCHPKFSDRQRLIIHAIMVDQWIKGTRGTGPPPEMKEG
ncbi:MAG TPA: class E sortase [Actinophytocola sp.]|uniref:class E sortase n=1 Tax=Actinophytocola sp. TaxID=1872138 RepID=UPI002DDCA62A|nr:class E sortase [Actinophytocola sp.]HEV2780359.1 class E sortase [Actinophytocola sp.]